MKRSDVFYEGLSRAAWGYFLVGIDFSIGTVSILPRFAGFFLLLSAIGLLSEARREMELLQPLCILLAVWSAADWLLSWGGWTVTGHILFLDLLVCVAQLYFHFQFLTDMAAIAERYQPEGGDFDRRLRRWRTMYLVLVTGILLLTKLMSDDLEVWKTFLATMLMIASAIVSLCAVAALFGLRKCLRTVTEIVS